MKCTLVHEFPAWLIGEQQQEKTTDNPINMVFASQGDLFK